MATIGALLGEPSRATMVGLLMDGRAETATELRRRRRPLCRPCLDWSERRSHQAGALGAALFDRLLALRFARRDALTRTVRLSRRGEAFIETLELG